MPKRILVVENSDAVRGVAETVLRQNGFEVIGVADAGRAKEVLDNTRPDVMLVGVDVEGTGNRPYFENLKQNTVTASIPTLIFADKSDDSIEIPAEVIVPRPFEPRELLEKVTLFTGKGSVDQQKTAGADPLADASLEDDFLDAALGLEPKTDPGLEVTDSEIMDKTQITKRKDKKREAERVVGYDDDKDTVSDSGRVESIQIGDDQTDIHRNPRKDQPSQSTQPPANNDTGGLDILDNAYGITDPDAAEPDVTESAVHDYQWFMNSLQNEAADIGKKKKEQKPAETSGDDQMQFEPNSSYVDPHTPGPKESPPQSNQSAQPTAGQKNKDGQVDKYIDEFKRELENLRHVEPDIDVQTAPAPAAEPKKSTAPGKLTWEESIDKLNEEQLRIFTREFADRVAQKLALRLIEKLDTERLLQMLKSEIVEQVKRTAKQ